MKASITTSFARAYKYGNVTAQAPEEVFNNITYPYNLGEFEKVIDLSRFDVTYYKNDVNQEHPVYILKNEYSNQKINLNGESVSTFYTNDKKSIDFVTREEYTDKIIGCGFSVPASGGNNIPSNHTSPATAKTDEQDVDPEDRYNQVYYNQNQSRYTYFRNYSGMVPRAQYVYDNLFENGTVDGITPVYWPDDDSMIVPAVDIEKMKVCYYNNVGNKIYMREPMAGTGLYIGALTYGGANIYYQGWNGMFELLQEVQTNPEEDTYLTFYPPVPYSGFNINSKMGYGKRTYSRIFDVKTIPIFLRDKNGEYWFWNIARLPSYVEYGYPRPGSFTSHFEYVVKVKDLPAAWIANGVISDTECVWITSEQFTDIGQVDRYLDAVFNPEIGPSYNDDGPDIVGPDKDPYDGVLDNTDEMIGGEPNMEDKIEQDDGTYNDSGSIIRGWGSFYGSYVLNQGALSQYVNTLTWLNGKWGSLLWPVYNLMSDRIKNNTINLIHLPFRVPDANVEQRPFTVGNTAIMQSTTDRGLINDWELGRITGIATVNLLQKEITTDVVNLGVLGHYYDNFLDFAPYSSASLYIPYIGTVELPINLIQSTSEGEQKQLQLLFRINNSTGDMIVLLQVNGSTVKQWSGNCARDIQISVDATGGVLRSMSNTIVGGMLGAITGGLGGNIAIAAAAGGLSGFDYQVQKEMYEQSSPEMRRETTWGQTTGARLADYEHKQQSAGAAGKAMVNSMQKLPEVNSSPVPNHSIGNMPTAGEIGFMGPQEVRLIVERPIIWRPKDYGDLIGYPTKKIAKLSSVKGFAKVSNIHLRCNATLAEKTEIEQMLNAGVIFSDN